MASLASRFASFCLSASRRSWNFLPLRHGQFTFGNAVPEVNLGRNDGHSFLLGLDQQAVNFAAVKQQFPFAKRIVVPEAAGLILRNMAVYQPSLALANFGIGLAEGPFAFAQASSLRFPPVPVRLPGCLKDGSCRRQLDSAQQSCTPSCCDFCEFDFTVSIIAWSQGAAAATERY